MTFADGRSPVRLLFAVEILHLVCVVAGTGNCVGRDGGLDRCDLFGCERDFESGKAFAELCAGARADDWNDGRTLGESPCDGELGLRDSFAGSDLGQTRNEFLILREVLGVKAREAVANVALAAVRGIGEKSARGFRKR